MVDIYGGSSRATQGEGGLPGVRLGGGTAYSKCAVDLPTIWKRLQLNQMGVLLVMSHMQEPCLV